MRGATWPLVYEACEQGRFQSTHPVRGATSASPKAALAFSFQSTHPVRGATFSFAVLFGITVFQSTHPVRGATAPEGTLEIGIDISIHAPREGCDKGFADSLKGTGAFQSTHPVRGATWLAATTRCSTIYFNPRTP